MSESKEYKPGDDPGIKCADGDCGLCDECYREYVAAKLAGELDT